MPIWKQKYFTQNVAHIDEHDENTMESSGSVSADPDFTMDLKTGKISLLRLGMKKEEIGNHAKDKMFFNIKCLWLISSELISQNWFPKIWKFENFDLLISKLKSQS